MSTKNVNNLILIVVIQFLVRLIALVKVLAICFKPSIISCSPVPIDVLNALPEQFALLPVANHPFTNRLLYSVELLNHILQSRDNIIWKDLVFFYSILTFIFWLNRLVPCWGNLAISSIP